MCSQGTLQILLFVYLSPLASLKFAKQIARLPPPCLTAPWRMSQPPPGCPLRPGLLGQPHNGAHLGVFASHLCFEHDSVPLEALAAGPSWEAAGIPQAQALR